jgi:hypothetical protein
MSLEMGKPGGRIPANFSMKRLKNGERKCRKGRGQSQSDLVDVHDCRAVDSQELRRVESGFEIIHLYGARVSEANYLGQKGDWEGRIARFRHEREYPGDPVSNRASQVLLQ